MYAKLKNFSTDYQNYLADEVSLQDDEKEELAWRRINYWIYFLFIIAVGVPVWYLTTTPYRASLPSFDNDFREHLKDIFSSTTFSSKETDGSQSSNVWNQMTLFPVYNVHFVFVHDVSSYESDTDDLKRKEFDGTQTLSEKLLTDVHKFSGIFNESLQLNISAEHFWDFSLADFLLNHPLSKNEKLKYLQLHGLEKTTEELLIINHAQIPALTTEIDRLSTPPIGSEPLIKIVIFCSNKNIEFFDHQTVVRGLTVASWGGFVSSLRIIENKSESSAKSLSQEVIAILRIQLRIHQANEAGSPFESPFLSSDASTNRVLKEVHHHKLALTMENLLLTAHFINSLHDLKDKLEDLVISEEVAQLAQESYENFFVSYKALIEEKKIDALSSSRARMLAERAVTHPSLLEFLNFPSDQKYGIYVPLFFPLLVPIVFPLLSIVKFMVHRSKIKKE